MELPRSISDAAQFYRAEERNTVDKLFCSQYLAPNYPVPFADQLKQLIELFGYSAMARRANSKQLFRAREAACECLPSTRSHQAVGLYRGCANGLRPRKGALGEDGC